jgi:hypothetical protein
MWSNAVPFRSDRVSPAVDWIRGEETFRLPFPPTSPTDAQLNLRVYPKPRHQP